MWHDHKQTFIPTTRGFVHEFMHRWFPLAWLVISQEYSGILGHRNRVLDRFQIKLENKKCGFFFNMSCDRQWLFLCWTKILLSLEFLKLQAVFKQCIIEFLLIASIELSLATVTGYKCCLISYRCNASIDEEIQKGSSQLTKLK